MRLSASAAAWLSLLLGALGACGSPANQSPGDAGTTDASTADDIAVVSDLAPDDAVDSAGAFDGPITEGSSADVDLGPRPTPLHWVKEKSGVISRVIGGTGPNDIWVAGDNGEVLHSQGDGVWTVRNAPTGGRITGIWGTAPDNVYFSLLINLVLHWNGAWERQTNGIPIGTTFDAVWGSGPNDVYVASALFHSAGDGQWTLIRLPNTLGPILSMWGSGPDDVWAMGGANVARKKSDGKWTVEPTGQPNGNQAIWGSGPTDVYIVSGQTIWHTIGDGKWSAQTATFKTALEGLFSIWGSGPDDIYAGSSDGGLFHSIGDGKWYREVMDPANPRAFVESIWGTSRNNVYTYAGDGIYHGT